MNLDLSKIYETSFYNTLNKEISDITRNAIQWPIIYSIKAELTSDEYPWNKNINAETAYGYVYLDQLPGRLTFMCNFTENMSDCSCILECIICNEDNSPIISFEKTYLFGDDQHNEDTPVRIKVLSSNESDDKILDAVFINNDMTNLLLEKVLNALYNYTALIVYDISSQVISKIKS